MHTLFALILQFPVIVIGFFVVPIALPDGGLRINASGRPGFGLPSWALWWDNIYDGADGDARGWWAANCATDAWFGWFKDLKFTDFAARYWWLAFRNPANNFKRNIAGVDCTRCKVKRRRARGTEKIDADKGSRGWAVTLFDYAGKTAFCIEAAFDYGNGRGFYVQIGHKVSIDDLTKYQPDDLRRMKGVTLEINPFKVFS